MNKKMISFVLGLFILFVFILMALFPRMFTSYGIKDMFELWEKPNGAHILGTNDMGYDIFTELVYGARETIFIGVMSSILSLLLGVVIGILSTEKGPIGAIFNGLINIFVLLPKLIILIVLCAFLGNSKWNLILLISSFGWSASARQIRAKTNSLKNMTFIESARILGYNRVHVMIFHILPNLWDVILTRLLLGVTSCMMMESTLSFLGMGDIYYPSWGTMINLAYKRGALFRGAYNYLLAPGICIMLICFSVYLISSYYEDRKKNNVIGG